MTYPVICPECNRPIGYTAYKNQADDSEIYCGPCVKALAGYDYQKMPLYKAQMKAMKADFDARMAETLKNFAADIQSDLEKLL